MKLTAGTVGGLIGTATLYKDGLAEKGSASMHYFLEHEQECSFNRGYCLIHVGSYTYGDVGLFLKDVSSIIKNYASSRFSNTEEEGKICILSTGEYNFKVINKTGKEIFLSIAIIGGVSNPN